MRGKTISFTMAVLDRNGISVAQTPTGSGNLTITGALATGGIATLDKPRRVGIYSDGNDSGVTFTVYGTHRFGAVISETITGPNTTTVNSTKNYKTITRVSISGAGTGSIEVGTCALADTQVVPVDGYSSVISYSVSLSSGASLNYHFKYSLDNPLISSFEESSANWISDLGIKSTNSASTSAGPFRGCRLEITNWSSASDIITWQILTARR